MLTVSSKVTGNERVSAINIILLVLLPDLYLSSLMPAYTRVTPTVKKPLKR